MYGLPIQYNESSIGNKFQSHKQFINTAYKLRAQKKMWPSNKKGNLVQKTSHLQQCDCKSNVQGNKTILATSQRSLSLNHTYFTAPKISIHRRPGGETK